MGSRRFSMLELIVVMLLLVITASLVAPRLTGFFRGRRLDDEARRVWALTRYAREQAITQAVPVRLWIDTESRRYGVEAVPGYGFELQNFAYDLGDDIDVEVTLGASADAAAEHVLDLTWWPDGTLAENAPDQWAIRDARNPLDGWLLVRQTPLSTFSLEREKIQ